MTSAHPWNDRKTQNEFKGVHPSVDTYNGAYKITLTQETELRTNIASEAFVTVYWSSGNSLVNNFVSLDTCPNVDTWFSLFSSFLQLYMKIQVIFPGNITGGAQTSILRGQSGSSIVYRGNNMDAITPLD